MTYAEWMRKRAKDEAEAANPAATKRPLTSGEIGWGVLGGGGGAMLGWTLARLLHRKPSMKTKLLYSVLGAAGGLGGSRYLLTHIKDSTGQTPQQYADKAEAIANAGGTNNNAKDPEVKGMIENRPGQSPEELLAKRKKELEAKYTWPSWDSLSIANRNKWDAIGAGVGLVRGAIANPRTTGKDGEAKNPKTVMTWPGRVVTGLLDKSHYKHVQAVREANKATYDAYKQQKAQYDSVNNELQQSVDDAARGYKQLMPSAGRMSDAQLRQLAFDNNTQEDIVMGGRTYKGQKAVLGDNGKVQVGAPVEKPEMQKSPARHPMRDEAIARSTNAIANAATHAVAADLLNRGAGALYNWSADKYKRWKVHSAMPPDMYTRALQIADEMKAQQQ